MDKPRVPHNPQEPNPPGDMEALLIDEITTIEATLGVDPQTASTKALGRQSGRHENLAVLYRRLAIRRGQRYSGEAAP